MNFLKKNIPAFKKTLLHASITKYNSYYSFLSSCGFVNHSFRVFNYFRKCIDNGFAQTKQLRIQQITNKNKWKYQKM